MFHTTTTIETVTDTAGYGKHTNRGGRPIKYRVVCGLVCGLHNGPMTV